MSKKDTTKESKKAEPKKAEAKKSSTPKKDKPMNKLSAAIDNLKGRIKNATTSDATLVTDNIGSTSDITPIVNADFGKEEVATETTNSAHIGTPTIAETPAIIQIANTIPAPVRNMNEVMAENQLMAFADSLESGLKNNNALKRHGIMPFKEITTMIDSSPKDYTYEVTRQNDICAIVVRKGALSQRVPKNVAEWFRVY